MVGPATKQNDHGWDRFRRGGRIELFAVMRTTNQALRVRHSDVSPLAGALFGGDVPNGFQYRRDFMTSDDEALLVDEIARLEFSAFEMHGVVARRRVAFFGRSYDAGAAFTPPLPEFLLPLRERVAVWASVDPHAFEMALINEYTPGAPIGWHRDAPQYDIVAGVSLLSSCRMKFRPYLRPGARASTPGSRRSATHAIHLERRSAYLLTGESRNGYEHHIPAVAALRYSITFRTLRS
jgi:alkylated DNA repair dioxygenase AlkB